MEYLDIKPKIEPKEELDGRDFSFNDDDDDDEEMMENTIFSSEDNLGNIMNPTSGVHSSIKSYECDRCRKSVTAKIHFEGVHLKLKPYECALCDSSFRQIGALKGHIY